MHALAGKSMFDISKWCGHSCVEGESASDYGDIMVSFWEGYGKEIAFGVLFTVGIVFAVAMVERVFKMKKTDQNKHMR